MFLYAVGCHRHVMRFMVLCSNFVVLGVFGRVCAFVLIIITMTKEPLDRNNFESGDREAFTAEFYGA